MEYIDSIDNIRKISIKNVDIEYDAIGVELRST